jgi:hypothetical protein
VQTTANVRNTSGGSVGSVVFNLSTLRTGHANVGAVTVNGASVNPGVSDQTIFVPASLSAGESANIVINYTATLSTSTRGDYFGFAQTGGVMTAYRWIPWLSRATRFNRPSVGEPWVTPTSPYVHVTISTDRRLTFATSGRKIADSGLTQTFVANNVRDFNFSAAPDYKQASRTVRGTRITFFYRTMSAATVLNLASRAFNSYSARIGSYPFSTLNIGEIMRSGADIESPSLFWIAPGYYGSLLSWTVSHEVAHQWFYSVVGNDQSTNPFADEAVSDFLARDLVDRWAKPKCGTTANLDQTIYQLSSCYPWVIYVQGNLYLKAYRDAAGDATFYRGLSNYYNAHRYDIVGTRAVLDALENATGLAFHHERFPTLY